MRKTWEIRHSHAWVQHYNQVDSDAYTYFFKNDPNFSKILSPIVVKICKISLAILAFCLWKDTASLSRTPSTTHLHAALDAKPKWHVCDSAWKNCDVPHKCEVLLLFPPQTPDTMLRLRTRTWQESGSSVNLKEFRSGEKFCFDEFCSSLNSLYYSLKVEPTREKPGNPMGATVYRIRLRSQFALQWRSRLSF